MAKIGYSDDQIACGLNVIPATLSGWMKNIPFLRDLIDIGKDEEGEKKELIKFLKK